MILGHVRSEHLQLTLVTTNGINLQVQRVDSDTGELIFDEPFCRSGSDLEINLESLEEWLSISFFRKV